MYVVSYFGMYECIYECLYECMYECMHEYVYAYRKIAELQHSINIADERKRNTEAQMLSLAQKLAVHKEVKGAIDKNLSEFNYGAGNMLPIVVGRSIAKIAVCSYILYITYYIYYI